MQGGKLIVVCTFGMRIGGGAHLLSCCLLVDHMRIPLILQVDLIGQMSPLGDKTK